MNGTLLTQFNIQGETDTYKQDYDTFLLPFDLGMSTNINRNQLTLSKNVSTFDNLGSTQIFGAVNTFLYIRASQGLKLSLNSPNLTGFINMDRVFFTATQLTTFTLTNLNTLFDAQILIVYG